MNSVVRTAVVGAIAAAFVASVVVAQGLAQGRGLGRGPGFAGPGGPGGRGLMPAIMRELTDQQREQVRAIMEEQRPEDRGAGAKLHHALQIELLADAPHEGRIEELKQQILAQHGEALTRRIETRKRVAQVLTAEQRTKARELLAQAPQGGRR